MRKFVLGLVLVSACSAAVWAADDQDKKMALLPEQPRTMEQVIDRVTNNENHLYGKMKEYSPLVETYIQNLKPDKELGFVPAGDKYYLGKADFGKGVNLVSISDTDSKGKKVLGGVGNFFSFAMQYLPDGFLQMIFIDTNGFDRQ